MCFKQSLELSRAHGSRAWELRTAADLAALWAGQGRSDDARALLLPVFEHFTEGLETADLKAAERVLATLGGGQAQHGLLPDVRRLDDGAPLSGELGDESPKL